MEVQGQLILRRAAQKEGQALYELRYLAYLRPYALYSSPESPCLQSMEAFMQALEAPGNREICGLYLGTALVGGAQIRPEKDRVCIEELYVDPSAQGRGLGRQALHLLESRYPSAVYEMELPSSEHRGLFYEAGYRPAGEGRQAGPRCRMYPFVKEAYKQVEILLGPLKREELPAVETMARDLSERQLFDFSGGAYTTPPNVETLSAQLGAGKHRTGAARLDFAVEVPEYGAVIGIVSLTELEWEVKRGQVSHLLIDPRWRGVGLGARAVESVCRAAFEKYGFRGLTANVLEDNEGALRCFEESGFRVTFRREKAYETDGETSLDYLALMRRAEDGPINREETEEKE